MGRKRKGRLGFLAKMFFGAVLRNLVPFLKNKIIESKLERDDVKNWLAVRLEIVHAIIAALLDLNETGIPLKERLILVFNGFYKTSKEKKYQRFLGMQKVSIMGLIRFIISSALPFIIPRIKQKIIGAVDDEEIEAWLLEQLDFADDLIEELLKGKETLKGRLIQLFIRYTEAGN